VAALGARRADLRPLRPALRRLRGVPRARLQRYPGAAEDEVAEPRRKLRVEHLRRVARVLRRAGRLVERARVAGGEAEAVAPGEERGHLPLGDVEGGDDGPVLAHLVDAALRAGAGEDVVADDGDRREVAFGERVELLDAPVALGAEQGALALARA